MNGAPADYDVAIVGGGYTGATLALALAHGGLRAALIDPDVLPSSASVQGDERAYAIAATSLAQWRALGLAEALLVGAQPITSIAISDARTPGAARSGGLGGGLSGLLQFDQSDLGEDGEPLGHMIFNERIRKSLGEALLASGVALETGAGPWA